MKDFHGNPKDQLILHWQDLTFHLRLKKKLKHQHYLLEVINLDELLLKKKELNMLIKKLIDKENNE